MPNQTPAQSQGPMVLVKRADGTMARVLLSELNKMRAGVGALTQKSKLKSQKSDEVDAGKEKTSRFTSEVAQGLVAKQAGVESAGAKKKWQADDHKSLLDDSFHNENLPMVIEARRQALAKVSPVKGMFSDAVASKIRSPKFAVRNPVPSGKQHDQSFNFPYSEKNVKKSVRSSEFGVRSNKMHDVVRAPAVPQSSVGPVDELRQFTLADWRRLAPSAQAAGAKLEQKFKTLKDESFMLYLDGREAWQESPLYNQYLNVVVEALRQRQSVAQILSSGGGEGFNLEEFKAVVGLNRALSYK